MELKTTTARRMLLQEGSGAMGIVSQLASKRRGVGEGGEVEEPRHGPGKPGEEVVVLGIGVEKFGRNESQCRESCI